MPISTNLQNAADAGKNFSSSFNSLQPTYICFDDISAESSYFVSCCGRAFKYYMDRLQDSRPVTVSGDQRKRGTSNYIFAGDIQRAGICRVKIDKLRLSDIRLTKGQLYVHSVNLITNCMSGADGWRTGAGLLQVGNNILSLLFDVITAAEVNETHIEAILDATDFISKYKAKEYIFSRDTKKLGRPGYAILPLYFPNYECKVILDAAQGFEQRVTTMDLVVGAATTIDHCVGNRPRVVNGGIVFVESQTKGYFVDVIVSDGGPHSVGANSTASFEELKQIAAAHETVKPVQIG
ncbi:uncharacterized protein KY384_004182 [Bacidia gigantensis]|uniref:uncharacterized protein n=1 Tax=Bacidia gigantensis TaxID=2732470 RepID=UPI001D054B1A|nr:uncharacterized protein KY384_004182 [Bacidia gigantensis]KAG8530825.1 hypothetical protein KY384_004182 [Bacidia gigantensis]